MLCLWWKFALLVHLKEHGNENDQFLRKLFLIGPLQENQELVILMEFVDIL